MRPFSYCRVLLSCLLLSTVVAFGQQYEWVTVAGNRGGPGMSDGTGDQVHFNNPTGIASDAAGTLYISDTNSHTIRKMTAAGVVTTLAGSPGLSGSANGTGSAARFNQPRGLKVDSAGNVFVADKGNHTIRKITPAGVVTTYAGSAGATGSTNGTGSAARFDSPTGVAVDSVGNVYVADTNNQLIRKITPSQAVTTLAGNAGMTGLVDGTGIAAKFQYPAGLTSDAGGTLYVADTWNHSIRRVTPAGVVTTIAGTSQTGENDGTGSGARFTQPPGLTLDGNGILYVVEDAINSIRRVTTAGVVTRIAGYPHWVGSTNGTGMASRFDSPMDVAADGAGNLYVADSGNNMIRRIAPGYVVTTWAGNHMRRGKTDGQAVGAAAFRSCKGVAVDPAGNLYIADTGNHTIRKITTAGAVSTLAGSAGVPGSTDNTGVLARFRTPAGIAVDSAGNVYVADTGNHTIRKVTPAGTVSTLAGSAGSPGSTDGTGSAARFSGPAALAVDSLGIVFVADTGNHTIRKITPGGVVTLLAGFAGSQGSTNGMGNVARFSFPAGICVDAAGNLFVADTGNHIIRKIAAGAVTTLAGTPGSTGTTDGTGSAARFNKPLGIATSGGNIFVADSNNHTLRKITAVGAVTIFAGLAQFDGTGDNTGTNATFRNPAGLASNGSGNLWVADLGNSILRKVSPGAVVVTVAGIAGEVGSGDGTALPGQFDYPYSSAVDAAGNVFVTEFRIPAIRRIAPDGTLTTFSSSSSFNAPASMVRLSNGDLYVLDSGKHAVFRVTPAGAVSVFAGTPGQSGSTDGTGSAARFSNPRGIAHDGAGNFYVADGYHTVRKITEDGVVTTFAGTFNMPGTTDGTGANARFKYPAGLAADAAGNVYVADNDNDTIRKITPAGVVTTFAGSPGVPGSADGTGTNARFYYPTGVAVDGNGNVYVTDYQNSTIRKITPARVVTTIGGAAGLGLIGDGTGSGARFHLPRGITVAPDGSLYVADTDNYRIVRGQLDTTHPPVLTAPASGAVLSHTVIVSFSLPERALPGSLVLAFESGSGTRTLTLAAVLETAGSHSITFEADNPMASAAIAAISGGTSIPWDTYSLTIRYRDAAGSPAAEASVDDLLLSPLAAWKLVHLGDALAADDGDADNDGLSNLGEYGLLLPPEQPNASTLSPSLFDDAGGRRLRLFVPRDSARSDISIFVESAGELAGPWAILASSIMGSPFEGPGYAGGDNATPGIKSVEVRDGVTEKASDRRFMRVRVTR
jgi:sugar lactone lactonase YvrE